MLYFVKVVFKVWYLVGIDLIDVGKVFVNGNCYFLIMMDYFSKYVEVIFLLDKSVVSVVKGFYKVYCCYGVFVYIILD